MTITSHGKRKNKGRPPIDEIPLPPNVQRALTLRSGGASWKDAAAAVDMDYRTLRRYVRSHPDSLQFLAEQTKDALDQSHSVLIASAPAVAERLLQIALDPKTKSYAAVSACQAVFAIIDKGVTDRENAEQLRAIRESLNILETGRVIDV